MINIHINGSNMKSVVHVNLSFNISAQVAHIKIMPYAQAKPKNKANPKVIIRPHITKMRKMIY